MDEKKAYVLVSNYSNEKTKTFSEVEVLGVYTDRSEAVKALAEERKELVETEASYIWEAQAYRAWQEDGEDSGIVVEDYEDYFGIYEADNYGGMHSTLVLFEKTLH